MTTSDSSPDPTIRATMTFDDGGIITNDDPAPSIVYRTRFSLDTLYTTHGQEIRLPHCNLCGAWVARMDIHIHACPVERVNPIRPEALQYDQHAIAQVIEEHEPFAVDDNALQCGCPTRPRFGYQAAWRDWAGHVAHAIATRLGDQ